MHNNNNLPPELADGDKHLLSYYFCYLETASSNLGGWLSLGLSPIVHLGGVFKGFPGVNPCVR